MDKDTPKDPDEPTHLSPPPPSIFKDSKLLSKEHFNFDKYVQDRANYGLVDGEEATADRITALYFSASWCPPCQEFTPVLKQVVAELKERNAPLQIIFVSYDRTKEAMEEYYLNHHGDWLAVLYDDPLKETLCERFNITAIPKLIVLRPDGDIITVRGRKDVHDKGMLCFRSWLSATTLSDTLSVTRVTPRAEEAGREEEGDDS